MKGYAAVLVFATGASLLAACSGSRSTQSLVPGTSSFGNFSWSGGGIHPAPAFPPCSAKSYQAPGKFTVLAALGAFSGNSFSGSGLSLWGTFTVPKGRSQLPNRAPNLHTQYTIYYGTYKVGGGFVGCFYLAKINYKGVSFNGAAAAWPNLHNYGNATSDAEGPLAISIKNISGKGGSGTLTLKDPSGKTVSTGSVTIKGSVVIK
jgi:hypothetical protein